MEGLKKQFRDFFLWIEGSKCKVKIRLRLFAVGFF